jgi:hypothetical protein
VASASSSGAPSPFLLITTNSTPCCLTPVLPPTLQIQGLNKKGAQFFAFTTRLTDPISALQVRVVGSCCVTEPCLDGYPVLVWESGHSCCAMKRVTQRPPYQRQQLPT